MIRSSRFLTWCFVTLGAAAAGGASAPDRRPNILVVLSDDMGFSDLGCYGGEITTPNLDALAAGGVRFTQFYNTARCCPTRASLLTGLYPHQAGVGHMMNVLSSMPTNRSSCTWPTVSNRRLAHDVNPVHLVCLTPQSLVRLVRMSPLVEEAHHGLYAIGELCREVVEFGAIRIEVIQFPGTVRCGNQFPWSHTHSTAT